MTTTIVTTDTDAVKTVYELELAAKAARRAAEDAFGLLLDNDFTTEFQTPYDAAAEVERVAYHEWQQAEQDELAYEAYLCEQHDMEADVLEYPRSYEDPIPYAITSAGSRSLASHNPTRSGATETYSDDLPF